MTTLPYPAGRRRESRLRVGMEALLERVAGNQRCELLDLSQTGARLRLTQTARVGDTVILSCGDIDRFATVVRAGDGECAVRFDDPLSWEMLVSFRAGEEALRLHRQQRESEIIRQYARSWVIGEIGRADAYVGATERRLRI